MDYKEILAQANAELSLLDENLIDILEIKRPQSMVYAKNLAKVISKLSPLLGNMIEFSTVDILRQHRIISTYKQNHPAKC